MISHGSIAALTRGNAHVQVLRRDGYDQLEHPETAVFHMLCDIIAYAEANNVEPGPLATLWVEALNWNELL